MVGVAQIAGILAVASHLHGVREGYRRPKRWIVRLSRFISLETMIAAGIGLGAIGFAVLIGVVLAWWSRNFGRAVSVLPAVIGSLLMTLGAQNVLGGFLLAIVSGNEANFLDPQPIKSAESGDGAEPSHPSPLPSQPPA
jgi:MFS family permease